MLDKDIYDDCCPTRFTAVGVITNVSYNQADINGFTLKLLQPGAITFDGKVISRPAIGHRQNVDMPGPMQYSNAERGWVETLVKEGMKVRVKGCVCGNGGYWGALEIDLVR
jgi:hypothetical protein